MPSELDKCHHGVLAFSWKQPEGCAGVFSLFFSLPLILQLLFRVTGGEAKGMVGCSDIAQAVMVPEGSWCGFSTDFGVVLRVKAEGEDWK